MSKIYEALLRAEQERATGTATQTLEAPEPLAPEPLAPNSFAPEPAAPRSRFADATALATPPDVLPEAPAPQTQAPAPNPSRFDPAKIAIRNWDPMLAQLPALEERGKAVEQFRSLRSRMFEFRDLNTLKSIIVCSGLPKEGKSFVTVNLAISFARHLANRVLLIDGDMRRSTLHKLLGAPGNIGLSEYLAGTASLADILQRPDPTHGRDFPQGLASLTFIAAGAESDKAADLSGNRRFDELIAQLSPFFDWIIVDSSPVNLVADGVNLARACDGVLLVARAGVTRYQSAQRALAELKASTMLGFVLNAVEKTSHTGNYYGYEDYDGNKTETELTEKGPKANKKEPALAVK